MVVLVVFLVAVAGLFASAGWSGAAYVVVFLAVVAVAGMALRVLRRADRRG